ncbi:MAG: lipoyl synthase [Candidatus Hatepunaea meridiana]|nr:lipoyl synthase [Candidatus Hatepunaea meridiana]
MEQKIKRDERLPSWLRIKLGGGKKYTTVKGLLANQNLHTVCQSARCPNLGECWGRGTATFMIMGDECTRNCGFCAVSHGKPLSPDPDEPRRLAEAARNMKLLWVVVTSVTRDDLPDGGAEHFSTVVSELRKTLPDAGVEILVPDFRGKDKAVDIIMKNPPDILNHNIETVPSLYENIRPGADFQRSIDLIELFSRRGLVTKSGMFVGLGESPVEVRAAIYRLRDAGCRSLTIGQYLQATIDNLPVIRYVHPDEFKELEDFAYTIGFDHVASGPLVRSSYKAEEAIKVYGFQGKRHIGDDSTKNENVVA